MKIAWYCKECKWLSVSDGEKAHDMNYCKCRKTALDLEEGYARVLGTGYFPVLAFDKEISGEWMLYGEYKIARDQLDEDKMFEMAVAEERMEEQMEGEEDKVREEKENLKENREDVSVRYGATNDEVLQFSIGRLSKGDVIGSAEALKNYMKLKEREKKCCGGTCGC